MLHHFRQQSKLIFFALDEMIVRVSQPCVVQLGVTHIANSEFFFAVSREESLVLGAIAAHSHSTLLTEKVTIADTKYPNHRERRLANSALVSFCALLSVTVPDFW